MPKPEFLTKSRFKEGLDCITKLYYTGKKLEYANQKLDDPFLLALADGGYQVGTLALYLFSNNPFADDISIETLKSQDALDETYRRLELDGKIVIAEAAFKHENLFIRADVVVKEGNTIDIYEVKSKSHKEDEEIDIESLSGFLSWEGKAKESIKSNWVPYLYDLAFQKYVVEKAFPKMKVRAHLILANKGAKASIEGLNQLFQIEKVDGRPKIVVPDGLTKAQLGSSILIEKNMDELIEKIWNTYPVPTTYGSNYNFEEYVKLCETTYVNDKQVFAPITSHCKDCSYRTKAGKDDDKKSGFIECWKNKTKLSEQILNSHSLITDLWQGRIDDVFETGPYLLNMLTEEDIKSKSKSKNKETEYVNSGLTRIERRLLQIEKANDKDATYFFDKDGFEDERRKWKYPYSLIDFETSMVALPFHKDTSPYQGIAFQFSHHKLYEDGNVEHYKQFLHFEKGVYPNLDFIRELKKSLTGDNGTIFRYHMHENTYLRMIHRQLNDGTCVTTEEERKELCDFIDNITTYKKIDGLKGSVDGERNMVDLYEVVSKYYYSPSTNGKIGLKFTLPSIIKDSQFLCEKYGKTGIYGKELEVKSLNFKDHQWINPDFNNDPYKTLPKIFDGLSREELDDLKSDIEGIADGGAALTAYNYLQYSKYTEKQRELIRDALLRYCELDTAAMVFLIEGMMNLENKM